MTDPELKCRIYDADRIVVRRTTADDGVSHPFVVEAFGDEGVEKDAYATAEDVRRFAHNLLALVDKEDDGKSDSRPRVGDCLRVTEANE